MLLSTTMIDLNVRFYPMLPTSAYLFKLGYTVGETVVGDKDARSRKILYRPDARTGWQATWDYRTGMSYADQIFVDRLIE